MYSEVLDPNQIHNSIQKQREENFQNAKNFQTVMHEMSEEMKLMKNSLLEKQKHQENMVNYPSNIPYTNNNDNVHSTQYLLQEQNKRIQDLNLQLAQLKPTSKDIGVSTNNERIEQDDELLLKDEIVRRIGNWTARDPYQGPMDNLYFPFGSSGGGAPNRDSYGNVQTTIYGQKTLNRTIEEREKKILASQVMLESLKHEMLDQRLRRLQDKQRCREPQENLSELISSFKVGRPKRDPNTGIMIDNHLNSSDVTNNKLSVQRGSSPKLKKIQTDENEWSHNYGQDLYRAAEERQILKKLEKLKEQQQVRRHMESWDQIWGREIRPHNFVPDSDYRPDSMPRSNHRNFYELSNS